MESEIWTIQKILSWTTDFFQRKGIEHPRLSAEWLLSAVCKLSRVELYVNFDRPLTPDELTHMRTLVQQRAQGNPLQYITGEMPFRHLIMRVQPGVLIPRPETETLVELALAWMDEQAPLQGWEEIPTPVRYEVALLEETSDAARVDETADITDDVSSSVLSLEEVEAPLSVENDTASEQFAFDGKVCHVLDIGTGSGCIALSLAHERPYVSVVATDVSPEARTQAESNVVRLNARHKVRIVEADLFPSHEDLTWAHVSVPAFDVIVSNPPYIPTAVLDEDVPEEVRDFEPRLALDGGTDGLDIYRRILERIDEYLKPGGLLVVELHETCLEEAYREACTYDFWEEVRIEQDLTGRTRFIVARKRGGHAC